MSAKAKQLIIIYTAAALVTLSVLSAVLYSKLADYRLTVAGTVADFLAEQCSAPL